MSHLHLVGGKKDVKPDWLVPCEICGHNTASATKRCNKCYSVEQGLEEYLSHNAGRVIVARILEKLIAAGKLGT